MDNIFDMLNISKDTFDPKISRFAGIKGTDVNQNDPLFTHGKRIVTKVLVAGDTSFCRHINNASEICGVFKSQLVFV